MEKAATILRGKNIRVTPQRLAVYEALSCPNKHLTAEAIYVKTKDEFPGLSLATIYAILELFTQKGLASELRINDKRACFEGRVDFHHHFLCRKCEKIFDLDIPCCPAIENKEVNGNIIEKLAGYFYGIGKCCRKD